MVRWQRWLAFLAATVAGVAICYVAVDRPVAFFSHANFHGMAAFIWMQRLPEATTTLAIAALVAGGICALTCGRSPHWLTVAALSGVSVIVAAELKNELKFLFGRTWPETWINNNPSLINNGVFGFNPMQSGAAYSSFPSGHTTAICAFVSVFWICFPRWRPLCAAAVAVVVIGLIGADYHFVSDIIAGGFVGCATGAAVVALWERGGAWLRPGPQAKPPSA